jgi:hypothetical protein
MATGPYVSGPYGYLDGYGNRWTAQTFNATEWFLRKDIKDLKAENKKLKAKLKAVKKVLKGDWVLE